MPTKRKLYRKDKAVKSMVRTRIGAPKPVRVLDEKVTRKPKHKKRPEEAE